MVLVSRKQVFALALSVLLAAACGKSDNSRPRYAAGVTGVTNTQPVSTLNNTQLQQICKSYDAYVNTYVDLSAVAYIACLPVALLTSPTREACQSSLQQCMAKFPKPISISAKTSNVQVCAQNLAQCQASVADIEGCVNGNIDSALRLPQILGCGTVADGGVSAQRVSSLVNVCQTGNSACTNFSNAPSPQ
jgi:methionine synthase I (cobalamin-dependent)